MKSNSSPASLIAIPSISLLLCWEKPWNLSYRSWPTKPLLPAFTGYTTESDLHNQCLKTISSFSAEFYMHLLLFNPKSDQQEEGLKLHDSKDSPMAGHKTGGGWGGGWCYWGLCIYLTGLNICPDNVYCDIQTEGRWLRPRNSLFAKRNRPTQKYNANVSWYHHLCLPR